MQKILLLFLLPLLLCAATIDEIATGLGRGVNLGNIFEPPNEGDWGVTMEWEYLDSIAAKGFSHIRVPVRWHTHFDSVSPLTIDPSFLSRVDTTIQKALDLGLYVLIDAHHYETLYEDPTGKREEFLQLWTLLANHYKEYDEKLLFEPLNEPHKNLSAEKWNDLLAAVIDTIRVTNPTRPLIIGLAEYGGMDGLYKLRVPENEKRAIVSVHYYLPFQFTHQGASWVGDQSQEWLGTTWDGSYQEKMDIFTHLEKLRQYRDSSGIPIHIGEFGAYEDAPMESRARWTEFCARAFERYDFPWSYWEFCAGFGLYDLSQKMWKEELITPILSSDTTILELVEDEYEENQLLNGDFSEGMAHWNFGVWNSDFGEATQSIKSGVSQVTITEMATNHWEIQLVYRHLSMEKGAKYRIQFECSSPDDGSFTVGVTSDGDYKNYYSSVLITPGIDMEKHSMLFTAPLDHDSLMFTFNLSHSVGSINIDNVTFQKMKSDAPVLDNGVLKEMNPVTDITVKKRNISFYNRTKESRVQILRANGVLISQSVIGFGAQVIRVPDALSSGIYFLQIGSVTYPILIQ